MVTIYGVRYSLELLRAMGTADIGKAFRIVARQDGTVTLMEIPVSEMLVPVARKACVYAIREGLERLANMRDSQPDDEGLLLVSKRKTRGYDVPLYATSDLGVELT
ncbi:MAG: hypothetical protein ACE15D_18895 [Candidatus Eisenbacteria bacterium]